MLASRCLFLVAALLASGAGEALADTVRVAGQDLELPAPPGYCFLVRENPMDAFVMDAVEQPQRDQSEVFLHFAACNELEEWHAGSIATYTRYGNIASPYIDGEIRTIRGATRADVLAKLKEGVPSFDAKVLADTEAMVNERMPDISVQGTRFLGLIGEDENAIYVAIVGTVEAEGQRQLIAGAWGMTFLRSIICNVYLYKPMAPGAVDELLAELKPYLAALVQDNL